MKYRIVGLYEMFTGILGILLVLFQTGKVAEDRTLLFTLVTGIILYSGLAAAGYALLNYGEKYEKYSFLVQALQLLSITYNGTQYLFIASAFFTIIIRNGVQFHIQLAPVNYNIGEVSTLLPAEIKIFLFPILLIAILLVGRKK